MDHKVIVISPAELSDLFQPIINRLDKIEASMYQKTAYNQCIYTEAEAVKFLKCSTKKLQNLRNSRKIGFIRENGGRKILYKQEHLLEYLESNEFKKKK